MSRITPDEGRIVVTGGGSGLGRALAQRFAALGFAVTIIGRRAEALAESAASHPQITPLPLDIADARAVVDAFRALAAEGPIAALVNNAAIYPVEDFLTGR